MRRRSALLRALALLAPLLAGSGAARADDAAPVEVDVELMLAVDISRSMDIEELRIQRRGYVEALRDPRVHAAIAGGLLGRVAISYVEWAGAGKREVIAPWTLVDGPEAALDLADALDVHPISSATGTSISDMLGWAADDLDANDFTGLRRVIDVSGDGPNNTGPGVVEMRDRALARGIVINGLPLMMKAVDGPFSLRELDRYYEDCVIGGPRSFLLPVWDRETFAETIRRKLLLEIADLRPPRRAPQAEPLRPIPVQLGLNGLTPTPEERPAMDCLIGEKLRARWLREGGWEW